MGSTSGFALEQISSTVPKWDYSFYRTSHGAEIDLVMEWKEHRLAVEFKCSKTPKAARGFHQALSDLNISDAWIIAPIDDHYPTQDATVSGLQAFLNHVKLLASKS